MPLKLHETRTLNVPQRTIYEVVANVQAYDKFLPWCLKSTIISRDDKEMIADLTIGYKNFKETYRSHVLLSPYHEIKVSSHPGPLKYLYTNWHFTPITENSTKIIFSIEFSLKSRLLQKALKPIFLKSMQKIVGAFQERVISVSTS